MNTLCGQNVELFNDVESAPSTVSLIVRNFKPFTFSTLTLSIRKLMVYSVLFIGG